MGNEAIGERLREIADILEMRIHGREPIDLALQDDADGAAEEPVVLEINSQPKCLDLDRYEVGQYRGDVSSVISTDAHDAGELDFMQLGVASSGGRFPLDVPAVVSWIAS